MSKNIHLLIIEGTAGVGKSTLIQNLIQQYAKNDTDVRRSFLHLAQTHIYNPLIPLEDSNNLTARKNLAHLQKILSQLEWYVEIAREDYTKVNPCAKFYGILETFHVTQCFRPGVFSFGDVLHIDSSLNEIGCKMIFLKADKTTLWERGIESRKDTDFINIYPKKFGSDLNAIHKYFCEEQSKMLQIIEKSKVPYKIFNINDTKLVEKAFNYWMS